MYSPNTVRDFSRKFKTLFEKQHPDSLVTHLDCVNLVKDVASRRGWSDQSRYSLVRVLKLILDWMVAYGYREKNPFQTNHFRRPDWKEPECLTEEEKDAYQYSVDHSIKEMAILSILDYCAIRPCEFISLKVRDTDFETRTLRVFGKGSKYRDVPFPKTTKRLLRYYVWLLKKSGRTESDPLFTNMAGNALTPKNVQMFLQRLGRRFGRRLYPYKYRHSFGGRFMANGGDSMNLAKIFGHKDVRTSMRYTHHTRDQLRRVYDRHVTPKPEKIA